VAATFIGRINKTTAENEQTWTMPALVDTVRAWAFAHWGGRFYVFVTTQSLFGEPTSQVHRLDPAAGAVDVILPSIPYVIVGAGVSTCAPVIIE
jgi:hypothetical protein